MINRKELAICKRRGHTFQGLGATEHWRWALLMPIPIVNLAVFYQGARETA